jgi:hypothetical protein
MNDNFIGSNVIQIRDGGQAPFGRNRKDPSTIHRPAREPSR